MGEDRDILERLANANPVTESDLPDSALEKEGEEIIARIRALQMLEDRSKTRRRFPRRIVWVPVGAAVLIAAILLPVLLARGEKMAPVTAYHQSTTSTTAHVIQAVTRGVALTGILQLSQELGLAKPPATSAQSADAKVVNQALDMGILLRSEGPDYQLWQVTTRAQYAVWLWRTFGKYLPPEVSVEFKDIGSLTSEEQRAIKDLAAAGILESNEGYFKGAADITQSAEQAILDRVRQTIQSNQ